MSISVLHILPEASEMYEGVVAKWAAEEAIKHAGESKEEHEKHGSASHAFPLPFALF